MRRPGRWTLPWLALAAMVAVAACGGEEETAEQGETTTVEERAGVEVAGLTLGTAVGADNRVTAETDTFRPTDTIHASVRTEGVAPSATLTARWSYEDGQVVDETSRTIAPNGPEVTEFHVSKPDGWPTGEYTVVILLDGREADRASFAVEAGG